MDLVCRHIKNEKINMGDGTYYAVDEKGVARDVSEEHAKKLLKTNGWKRLAAKPAESGAVAPTAPPEPPPPETTEEKTTKKRGLFGRRGEEE